jgi:hypothetical protein
MAIDRKYLDEAMEMLSGSKENQKVQLNNSFNQNVQGLEGQKAGVNQNFDNQLEQNTRNTVKSKNQYGNNTLSRGLGRSTIATSGQAGIQDQGNRIAGEVNQNRTDVLGQIEAQKVQLQQALQDSLLGIETQTQSDTQTLAMQLEQQAYERSWAREQFEWQKSQAGRSGGGGSYGGPGGGGSSDNGGSDAEFEGLLADYMKTGDAFVVQYAQRFKDREPTKYNSYMALYRAAQAKRKSQYTGREYAETTHTTKGGVTHNIR